MKKDGPNKGREFYKCPKQPPCQFFEWADASAQNTSYGGPRPGAGASTSGSNYQNPNRNNRNDGGDNGQRKNDNIFKICFFSLSLINVQMFF